MRKIPFIIILMLLSWGSSTAQEQTYADTNVVKYDGSDTAENDEYPDNDTGLGYDTTLHFFPLSISNDSVNALKSQGSYAYAKYLDSLLKQRQRELARQQQSDATRRQSSSSSESITLSSPDSFFASTGSKILLWGLAGAFILFVIYKLFLGDGIFRKNAPIKIVDTNKEEEVTAESDIDALISAAVRNKNYRLGVRYWYLKSLRHLSERGLLHLAVDKTNFQYVNEIKNPVQRNDFASLTLNYEYVWYGEFEVDQPLYQRLESNFSSFVKKV